MSSEGCKLDGNEINKIVNKIHSEINVSLCTRMTNTSKNLRIQNFVKKFKQNRILFKNLLIHVIAISYFAYATYYFIYKEHKSSESELTFELNKSVHDVYNNNHSSNINTKAVQLVAVKFDNNTNEKNKTSYNNCGFQWCNGYGMLLILFCIIYSGLCYYFLLKSSCIGRAIYRKTNHWIECISNIFLNHKYYNIIFTLILLITVGIFLFFETRGSEERLISLTAPVVFIACGYIFSENRKAIKWRTIIVGITLQFLLGLLCIRWNIGRQIFQCIGDKMAVVMPYSHQGAKFVYGTKMIEEQIFAFSTLPVIYFFSSIISILYYYGIMQWIVTKVGWILQKCLATTVCESINSAGNICLGMTESPLLIRPYIQYLTKSEIHAIMVSGFATVSGTVFAAYISFGANPAYLITSTVMAAPAALAFSKLYYPEIEESKTSFENIEIKMSEDSSAIDAATNGAQTATVIVLGIIANLIAFIAIMALLNGFVKWLGYLIGLDYLTFEWIFSKLFIPLCWSLGVPLNDCNVIAQIIAKKTIVNEFVAFQELEKFQSSGNIQSVRSLSIATFAICGFANPSSLGVYIGFLSSLCPQKRPQITAVALRSCIVGSIVCFVSASFVGLFMADNNMLGS